MCRCDFAELGRLMPLVLVLSVSCLNRNHVV